jgi:hypothetical protein
MARHSGSLRPIVRLARDLPARLAVHFESHFESCLSGVRPALR